MELTNITKASDNEFYPTPPELAAKMLSGIDWMMIGTVLEPSAGKGDLAESVARAARADVPHYSDHSVDIDCIEPDPYLRQILKYNFSDERLRPLSDRKYELNSSRYTLTEAERCELRALDEETAIFRHAYMHIVHDDFLTYTGIKHYDLIVMNPPFSEGDKHLLKALELQKNGGAIVCLLNAETIRNPFSATRMLLKQQLDKYEAQIEFVQNAFIHAERKTAVEVAIVRVNIPRAEFKSTIYERMEKAVDHDFGRDEEIRAIVPGDYIERAVRMYQVEVKATLNFIQEYQALKPYMTRGFGGDGLDKDPILTLVIERDSVYSTFNVNKYLKKVRLKYWRALFRNKEFTGKLTSNLQQEYSAMVEKMQDYDFSIFNIKQVFAEMNASMADGVKQTILDLFEKLTVEHTWYPECNANRHYFNGWKTNKAHKIGKKSIIPTHGMFSSYSWDKQTFNVTNAYKVLGDIEKAFNYLDGNMTADVDLDRALNTAAANGQTRNIVCKYFKVDLFKKGTTHIKFTSPELVEKLNIYAAKNKNWLPPNYGTKSYRTMDKQEQEVVDAFHGDGSQGTGEAKYEEVLAKAAYYLAEPNQEMTLLPSGTN